MASLVKFKYRHLYQYVGAGEKTDSSSHIGGDVKEYRVRPGNEK